MADPDAALHRAVPGKYKPPGVDQPASSAPATLADVNPGIPDLRSAPIGSTPIEDPSTLGQVFGASNREVQRDSMLADETRIHEGYAPIVQALGLDPTENPGAFGELDAASEARFGNAGGRLSKLATAAGVGEKLPFTNNRMADRVLQETLIAQEIRKQRAAKGSNFLPGVPDTVEGLRKYFLTNEANASAVDQATIARSPGGLGGLAASLGGGAVGTFHDPINIAALAIPGGGAKGLIQVAARDALINGLIELGQQPIVAHNREELGQHYTLGEGATNVITAGVGGAVFGSALHGAGKLGGAAVDRLMPKIFDAMPESVQRRWADKMKVGDVKLTDVLHDMDNHELTVFARSSIGAHMTPDETAATNTLERSADVAAASPYAPGPAGDATHDGKLADAINELVNNRRPQDPSPVADTGARAPTTASARPPAGTSTPAGAPRDLEGTIASFTAKVGHAENNTGNIHAKNPKSSASGPAQFTDPTFRDYYRQVYGQDPGEHPGRDLKDNPEVQSRLLAALTRDNAARLEAAREPVTEGNLYLLHFAGPDAVRILKADPDTPIERLLSPKALEANDFLKGKSASEVVAWAHKKMGGSAASIPPRGAVGELAAAGDDPIAAQLRAEALALDSQVIGLTRLPDGSGVNLYTRQVPSSAIGVDATRFQFKSGGDEFGVTERLRGVKEWDPGLAGRVTLWEDNAGKQWIADGHQRYGLARRIGAEHGVDIPLDAMVLREADGVSAEDARVWAALKNIAEGTGSPVDAAKVLRDAGEHALDRLPPKSPLVRDGAALARLSDEAFGAVYNERIPADQAAVIGHLLPDHPETHLGMVDLLIKTDPANRAQAQSIVRQAIAAGFHSEEQIDLFGSSSSVASLFAEKAKILERSLARLRKMRLVHNTAANEADTLEQAGSRIAVEQSQKEAQANAEAIAIVDRLAYRAGPVAEALDVAARELAVGGKLADATKGFVERIRELDLTTLDREAPADNGGGASVDGIGRGGDGGEEGPSLFAEPGDPGQPTLTELEAATSRFSDPDGPAVKQQAASLEHDLKAVLADPTDAVLHAEDPAAAARDQARALAAELTPGKPQMGPGWTWGERSNLRNDVPKGGMVLDLTTPHGNREFVFDKKGELVAGPLGVAGDRSFGPASIDQVLERQRGVGLEDLFARAADNQKELETLGPELGQAAGAEFVNPGAKSRERVLAKVSDYADPGEIKDLARGGFLVTQRGQGNKILEELRARGFPVYDKGWKPLSGYADRKLIVAFPNGGVAEIQIIPKAIADYKFGEGHKFYEIVHNLETPPAEVEAALATMKKGYEERLAGTDFAAIGKATENSVLDSGVPSVNADRTVSSDALRQVPATNTDPLLASSTATARSSSSKNLMTGASSAALDMGEKADPGKIARDRQLAELGAAAPQRAPSDVAQLGEIGLPLMDAHDQFKFRMNDGSADISLADLMAELDADKKFTDALKGCL